VVAVRLCTITYGLTDVVASLATLVAVRYYWPPSLLSNEQRGFFPCGKVAGTWRLPLTPT